MKYLDFIFLMLVFVLALVLSFLYPAATDAQEKMENPKTGEVGVWIPTEVQRGHLLTEAELQTCIGEHAKTESALEKKKQETADLRLAVKAGDQAVEAMKTTLVATNQELDKEKKQKQRRTKWLWGTGGSAVVAVVLVIIQAVL